MQECDKLTQINIGAFATELLPKSHTTLVHEILVPGGPNCDSSRESSDVVCLTHTKGRVLEAELGNAHAKRASGHANAATVEC